MLPLALLRVALAAEDELRLGLRGVGEVWQDPVIIDYYRSSRFTGAGSLAIGIVPPLLAELELSYLRMAGADDPGVLELVPMALTVCARKTGEVAEVFAGGGLALTVFSDHAGSTAVAGQKVGFDVRTGVRLRTGLVQPSIRPGAEHRLRRVDVEFLAGRRQHQAFGVGEGFDLSAWRAGIGLSLLL